MISAFGDHSALPRMHGPCDLLGGHRRHFTDGSNPEISNLLRASLIVYGLHSATGLRASQPSFDGWNEVRQAIPLPEPPSAEEQPTQQSDQRSSRGRRIAKRHQVGKACCSDST